VKRIEIGSFLELDLRHGSEYYSGECNIARLNSGRSGIYHSIRMLHCETIYLPYYLCPDVKVFLNRYNITIKYYYISENLEPLIDKNEENSAFLIVNYFGLLPESQLLKLRMKYSNAIVDNCSSFFTPPLSGCYNVYSCRKYFGVPDGCYVIGPDAGHGEYSSYPKDYSADTSNFLLKRIEAGCSAAYKDRMVNEERIDNSGVLKMSDLTRSLLYALDYEYIKSRRMDNFKYADSLFRQYNTLEVGNFLNEQTLPLFYPLLVRDQGLVDKLREYGIYTGRRWAHVVNQVMPGCYEETLSNYMVPIPIDHRYGRQELEYCLEVFLKVRG
jgi:hypothetical protein